MAETHARSAPTTSPASRARARCTSRLDGRPRRATSSCASSSRRASSRRSCAAAPFTEAPDITARICGICPVAYQMSAVHAIEDACGVEVAGADPRAAPAALLRRVDREPRAARLHAPRARLPRLRRRDRAGARRTAGGRARRCALKKTGNERDDARRRPRDPPDQRPRRRLLPRADAGASCARSSSRSSARARRRSRRSAGRPGFDFPERDGRVRARRAVACRTTTRSSAAASSPTAGLDIAPAEYDEHFDEEHVERSTALHSRLRERGTYLCGPLARFTLDFDRLSPLAREAAREAGLGRRLPQPVPQHRRARRRARLRVRRGAAADRRVRGARRAGRRRSSRAPAPATARARRRAACCYHRYALDADGTILDAKIVPPTSQNQLAIEDDLRDVVGATSSSATTSCRTLCEQTIRNYDPCISCATHFLDARGGAAMTARGDRRRQRATAATTRVGLAVADAAPRPRARPASTCSRARTSRAV